MDDQENLFDEKLYESRQRRAKDQGFVSFLHDQVISDLKERLNDQGFNSPDIGIIGPFAEYWAKNLKYERCSPLSDGEILKIRPNSKDLIVSALYLHSVNDPISKLVQMRQTLKSGGILFAYAFGENTLLELRRSFEYARSVTKGGFSPHINPMADTPTFGSLLRRAGFNYCVSDKLHYNVNYKSPLNLLTDLRGMGETNIMTGRSKRIMTKRFLFCAMDYYRKCFKSMNKDNEFQATFDIVCLTGWQSRPKKGQQALNRQILQNSS